MPPRLNLPAGHHICCYWGIREQIWHGRRVGWHRPAAGLAAGSRRQQHIASLRGLIRGLTVGTSSSSSAYRANWHSKQKGYDPRQPTTTATYNSQLEPSSPSFSPTGKRYAGQARFKRQANLIGPLGGPICDAGCGAYRRRRTRCPAAVGHFGEALPQRERSARRKRDLVPSYSGGGEATMPPV